MYDLNKKKQHSVLHSLYLRSFSELLQRGRENMIVQILFHRNKWRKKYVINLLVWKYCMQHLSLFKASI